MESLDSDDLPVSPLRQALPRLLSFVSGGSRLLRCLGTLGPLQALLIARLVESLPAKSLPLVAVVADEQSARALRKDLQFFLHRGQASDDPAASDPVIGLPELDVTPWDDASPERAAVLSRMSTLFRLSQGSVLSAQVVVASVQALTRKVVPKEAFADLVDIIAENEELDRDQTIKRLAQGGYTRAPVCEDPGTYAVRGGVLDVFVPLYRFPVRIEFYGDLVESIRFYDPTSQRTLRKTDEIYIHPVRETILTRGNKLRERLLEVGDLAVHPSSRTRNVLEQIESGTDFFGVESLIPAFHARMASLRDYLPEQATFVVVEPHRLYDTLRDLHHDGETAYQKRIAEHKLAFPPSEFYLQPTELRQLLRETESKTALCVELDPLVIAGEDSDVPTVKLCGEDHRLLAAELQRGQKEKHEHILKPLVTVLRKNHDDGIRSIIVAGSLQGGERLDALLRGYGLKPQLHRPGLSSLAVEQKSGEALHRFDLLDADPTLLGRLEIRVGTLLRGVDLPLDRVSIFSEAEIFGEKAVRKAGKASKKPSLGDLKNLEVGGYVVHPLHGVGRYRGLTKLPVRSGGVAIDFMHIEYDGGQLYLPVWRLSEVQRYVGAEGMTPKLDRMGGETWQKTRSKVVREIQQVAEELLKIYAQRQALPGHAFVLDSDADQLFAEFEATFPFEETPDQERAIGDVLGDMEASRPMDRLVCGDVGYGKTEVAMRAAAKAVLAGKQVAVLAPTTVLVEQHAATFAARMKTLPITVASLSRFRSRTEQLKELKDLAEGRLDIVVGTHRLLSTDVRFKDLGLVIIDEEQRFGVKHKERLRQFRSQVDTLTLTATPIPRTLHMALSGIREISIISTAPADRLAIRTIVARESDDLIRDGIERELKRGGQVFFVHNRVETIGKWARRLQELCPGIRIRTGHGQMEPEELEEVMLDFVEGRADVLLSTTIIESGLDIPRANTMFVDRADTFGLSQLYQLRGRIGRSTQRAFCYLLIPPESSMTADAKQRLHVLQRFSDLGSGFSIASHDLEIRGAGDLLGTRQSGTIAAVGFEMYTRMLEEAVAELRGQPLERPLDPDITCDLLAYIPEEYLPDTGQRLDFYRKLGLGEDEEQVADVLTELSDRYGSLPDEVKCLGDLMCVKALARKLRCASLELTESRLGLSLRDDTPLDPVKVAKLVSKPKSPWRITPDQRLQRSWIGDKERADRLQLAKGLLTDLLAAATG
ncbi:MAG: transcription-repair coupling factor [Polyangia bacterium]